MSLAPIKTSVGNGYCDCMHGCYELASLRDEETGRGYCPACAKNHLEMNKGLGIAQPPPSKMPVDESVSSGSEMPEAADPPGRLR